MTASSHFSDAIVETLAELGSRYLPLNPGSSFRGLHESLVNHQPSRGDLPEVILCPHEEICVATAHAYAKATGEVGWALIHNLVGLMHASMAIYNAWCDNQPVVVLGGGGPAAPSRMRAIDWTHSASVQSAFVRDIVKFDDDPIEQQATLDSIAQAWQFAGSAPRKPVYVTIDSALQEQEPDTGLQVPVASQFAFTPPYRSRPEEVREAAELLWAAQNPIVVGGQVGLRRDATPVLVEIVELLGAMYQDERNWTAFPTRHEHNLTGVPRVMGEADALLAADLLDLNWQTAGRKAALGGFRNPEAFGGRTVEISNHRFIPTSWSNAGKAPRPTDVLLQGDPVLALTDLLEALRVRAAAQSEDEARARSDRAARIVERHKAARAERERKVAEHWSAGPISAGRMVSELWEAVRREDWLLTLRNVRSWPEGVWEFEGAGQYVGHNGGGGVGYGPGALLGGALAARDRGQLAVAVVGDGDLLTGPGAIWTAVRHKIPMLVVVNNNNSYYQDEIHQIEMARERGRSVDNTELGIRMHWPSIDFGMLARSNGAWAPDPIEDPDDLSAAFAEGVSRVRDGEVAVVDVRMRRE